MRRGTREIEREEKKRQKIPLRVAITVASFLGKAREQFAVMLSRVNFQLPRVHPNSHPCESIKVIPIFRTISRDALSRISLLRVQVHNNAAL